MAIIDNLVTFFKGESKTVFNQELVKFFETDPEVDRNLDTCVKLLNDAGIKLSRRQVIGKLSICNVKNIVPKKDTPKVKKDNGPTKKELIANLVELLGLSVTDLLTFNNVKKAEIAKVIEAIKALPND